MSEHLLAEILRKEATIRFDLEEYLISLGYRDKLKDRIAVFQNRGSIALPWPEELSIVSAVKNKELQWVPAYRKYCGCESLKDLPLISKNNLRESPNAFLSCLVHPNRIWRKMTTGSTGPPIPVFYGEHFYFEVLLLSLFKVALQYEALEVIKAPVFCLTISDNRALQEFVACDPTNTIGLSVAVVIDETNSSSIQRVFSLLRWLRPACISTKPSVFEMLLHMNEDCGEYRPSLLISAGSHLSDILRSELEDRFNSTVVNAYGMTECGLIASECRNGSLHIDETSHVIEVLDSQGQIVSNGEMGEIVVSSIINPAMPLLRYRTGDRAAITYSDCTCGLRGPQIKQLAAREISCYRLSSGEVFSPTYFNDLFMICPRLNEFQLTQLSIDNYELLVEMKDQDDICKYNQKPISQWLEMLESHIANSIPGKPYVSVKSVVFRKDSKFQRYRCAI